MIGSRIFSKIFFSIEMKIKLKSTLYFDFCFVTKLIWSRKSHWNKTSTQMFHKITYNTIILAWLAIKFLYLNFLNISKVLAEKKISVQKLYDTANQNKSVINILLNWNLSINQYSFYWRAFPILDTLEELGGHKVVPAMSHKFDRLLLSN